MLYCLNMLPHLRYCVQTLDFLHHAMALVLIYWGVTERFARFVPHLIVCESSTIFLDITWILRKLKADSPSNGLFMATALAFILTFSVSRIANMVSPPQVRVASRPTLSAALSLQPAMLHSFFTVHKRDSDELGAAKYCLLVLQVCLLCRQPFISPFDLTLSCRHFNFGGFTRS